jgi:hypothetical protein
MASIHSTLNDAGEPGPPHVVRFRWKPEPDGQLRAGRETFKRIDTAWRWVRDFDDARETGGWPGVREFVLGWRARDAEPEEASEEPTLADFMEDWLRRDALPNLAPNTIASYLPAYNNHIRALPVDPKDPGGRCSVSWRSRSSPSRTSTMSSARRSRSPAALGQPGGRQEGAALGAVVGCGEPRVPALAADKRRQARHRTPAPRESRARVHRRRRAPAALARAQRLRLRARPRRAARAHRAAHLGTARRAARPGMMKSCGPVGKPCVAASSRHARRRSAITPGRTASRDEPIVFSSSTWPAATTSRTRSTPGESSVGQSTCHQRAPRASAGRHRCRTAGRALRRPGGDKDLGGHMTRSQEKRCGGKYLRPACRLAAEADPARAYLADATPYAGRRGHISSRLAAGESVLRSPRAAARRARRSPPTTTRTSGTNSSVPTRRSSGSSRARVELNRLPFRRTPATEILRCEAGDHDWERPKRPRAKPRFCPEHRGKRTQRRPAPAR